MTACTLQPSAIGSTIRHECVDYDWDELDDYGESPMEYCQACQDGVATWSLLNKILQEAKDDEPVDVEAAIVGTATLPFSAGEIDMLKNGNDPFMTMMILDPYRGVNRSWYDYMCIEREQQGLPMPWEEGGLSDEGDLIFDTTPLTVAVSQSDKAAEMYTDWEEPDEGWPEGVRKRGGRPWVYYRKRSIWVPTSSIFKYSPHAYIATNEESEPNKRSLQKKPVPGGPKEGCRGWIIPDSLKEESEDEGEWISTSASRLTATKTKGKTKSRDQKKKQPRADPIERTLQYILAEEKKAPKPVAPATQALDDTADESDDDLACLAFLARKR